LGGILCYMAEAGRANIVPGVCIGLIVAIVSSILWYEFVVLTTYKLGIISILVGFVSGYGVLKGAGGKTNRKLQIVGAVVALIGMVLSEYMIANHFVNVVLGGEGGRYVPFIADPQIMLDILTESLKGDPLMLLYWAVAVYLVYRTLEPKEVVEQPPEQKPADQQPPVQLPFKF
jgi:hypothetical protein